MRLFLIFALTFALSAQQDNKNDADAESMENGREIMKKVISGIDGNTLTKLMVSLNDDDLDKLTECIQSVCEMNDFVDLMQKILSVFRRKIQDDILIYQLMKSGSEMMKKAMNGIGEEMLTKVMESLNDDDLDKLTECIQSDCEVDDFLDLMQKVLNVLKGISHGEKAIYQLMKAFIKQGPLAELESIFSNSDKMALPYHQPVSGGLHAGMSIYVQGTVPKDSKRFRVDFARSQGKQADILLHMSPRINEEKIMLATFLNRRWGNGETHKMSLQKSEHFEMIFFVNGAGYQILVNGSLLCTFKHKMHPQRVRDIRVDGELKLQFLTVMGGQMMGNLALPYYHSVPGGLQPGTSVYMQGIVRKNAKRFRVDFTCSKRKTADIPFHFNPRFEYEKFVLNSFQASRWGDEKSCKMLLQKGEYFEVIFVVTEAEYQIIVNKKPVCSFQHRMPPERVQGIEVEGDLELQSLTMMGGSVMENTTLPYYQHVPGGLHPRMYVYMQGAVPEPSNSSWVNFNVDFACGQHKGADVLFHFNPHFNGGNVVLNTLQAGRWGKEEKHQNPFRRGEHFEAIFMVTEAGYQILVNGNHLCSFRHRMPPESVQGICANGDLKLQSLMVMREPTMGNMALPYHHSVPGGLRPGMAVYLQGTVLKHIKSFWVTFQVEFACGQHKEADIPFHLKPQFIVDKVLLNTFQSGKWGKEKKHKNPFRKGEPFEIIFVVTEAGYQILVNGSLFCTYKHIIPPQSIQVISASGHLELQSLIVMGRPVMENTMMTNPAFYSPPVPYTGNIPGGLGANKTITMRGSIPKNATRFEISLMAGQELALNINPRMQPWRCVARNSLLNNQWGTEENNLPFNPFQPGKHFEQRAWVAG
ncbi:uncharacterized protein LOC117677723 isoform X2 [Pantherophis guttatus]|uniref:Uncharacterized protein LOC117677723 isoform X2 n=1 Tax=Pantherophis guttatus TaxID=94885 RepID=A0A6P9DNU5_PANGU|nr:uncharacterized protein LOC117677723 isoform X2 [Pantherophis guttatus]